MLTHNMKNIKFQKLTPEDVWNLAILYAIQAVKDTCDNDYKLLSDDFRLLETDLRLLMFTDNEN